MRFIVAGDARGDLGVAGGGREAVGPALGAVAGAPLPKGQTIRGRSFVPLLRGETVKWDNDLYAEYSQHHYTTADLRMWRTPQYKLVRDFGNCVPVVVVNDKVRFRGHINEVLLQRILDARGSSEPEA